MRMPARQRTTTTLPGLHGTARVDRRTRTLLPRLRAGDVAVIDQVDLDRATAQALVDADVVAVVNASPMISGRYPALGPDVLARAGVLMVDRVGAAGVAAIRDGAALRLHDGGVHVGEDEVASGRTVDDQTVQDELTAARSGLVAQLDSFTHNSTEFLRREQDLLLHGTGIPRPATAIADRPVVVVVPGEGHREELAGVRRFIREQAPVLIAVDTGADALLAAGHQPDIVVVSGRRDEDDGPSAKALRAARDVVVQVDRGAGRTATDRWERLGVRPLRFESGATTEDAALLLADSGHASVIVGVGMHATLDEFLDRQRTGLASTYLTRLKVGPRLVDATAVPTLYSGRVRPRHVLWVLLAGLVALAVAVGTTPAGQAWADALLAAAADLIDYLQGLRS
ncbi:putative cytokinetic ring protein SteA [uncultured Nocardioides sp.]|uniref:FIG005773: conserved membrane protein ML1361 n=1 Tax=uncultured Nocardioides sp. TaxID=198441 RepID=A0A6J4N774_9ACTN|nr:putative cytokinetic ring protein SteA [uncultured Nocardioides sp.]CAA9379578.1 MAG: FIG005773: conserved membrane protein ML1361 [uncultured Nocardioides sp.]